MFIDTIRAELLRLQLHPVNLNIAREDDRLVVLEGSLLRYWKLPPRLDGQWLLEQLQGLPDAAGPEAVMSGLAVAFDLESKVAKTRTKSTQLRLFDPQAKNRVK